VTFTPLARLSLVSQRGGDLLGGDLAIDLGTANTLVYARGRGILLDEPSVVAIDETTGRLVAVGAEAKRMIGRTPGHIRAVRPLQDGVIADYDVTAEMLRYFVRKVLRRRGSFTGPRVVVCVPSGITSVEQRAVSESAYAAGARRVHIISEPMAAAIGAGLPVNQPQGSMIVDIGGGTTEVAIISLADISVCKSVRTAGDDFDEAIVNHMKKTYNMAIGEQMAERIKIEIGSAAPQGDSEPTMEVRGRDMISGLPRKTTITSEEIREALQEPVTAIIEAVTRTLELAEPELAADLVDNGITMAGGSSMLRGLTTVVSNATGLDVRLAVVRGDTRGGAHKL
jgi:rod shape-determining protein MreB